MKKILLMLYVVASLFLVTAKAVPLDLNNNNQIQLSSIEDSKIGIEMTRDGNTVTIKHTSGHTLNYAVVEYSYYDNDNNYVAMLDTFPVSNNKFSIPADKTNGKAAVAIKIHQLKVLRLNTYYTYSTSNQNSIGSFAGVTRLGFLEIKTTSIETVVLEYSYTTGNMFNQTKLKRHDFYFDFDNKHDFINYVDIEYVFLSYNWLGKEKSRDKIYDHIGMDEKRTAYAFKNDVIHNPSGQPIPTRTPYDEKYTALQVNANNMFSEQYVISVVPSNNKWMESQYSLENFVIVKIYYTVDGEYIIDDVINDPTTPLDQEIFDLMKLIEKIKDTFNGFINFFTNISNLFAGNLKTVFWVVVIIIGLFFLSQIISLVKLVFNSIGFLLKTIFKFPGRVINLFKTLFIPKKKQPNNRRQRRNY